MTVLYYIVFIKVALLQDWSFENTDNILGQSETMHFESNYSLPTR